MNSRTLTLATLRRQRACADQLALFKELFGRSVEVTEALAAEHAGKFSVEWAADYLLSPKARAAYGAAVAQAWDAYRAATAPDQEAYDAAVTKARTAFAAAVAQAWTTYESATAQAWAAYRAAMAQAWAKAYINDK